MMLDSKEVNKEVVESIYEIVTETNEDYYVEEGEKIVVVNDGEYVVVDAENKIVEVVRDEELTITETYTQQVGDDSWDTVIQFSDGSWACINNTDDEFIFQPVNMGDWYMEFDNVKQLKMAVATYIECSNYSVNSDIFEDMNWGWQ